MAGAGSVPASAGNHDAHAHVLVLRGSIPASAGGTAERGHAHTPGRGLSPRVRGNQGFSGCCCAPSGSIPASAGEPPTPPSPSISRWVYPRECGGTTAPKRRISRKRGLSPRVRGNLRARPDRARCGGSIPASAGEPVLAVHHVGLTKVYPRECGGTSRRQTSDLLTSGLSPRVRGNPLAFADGLRGLGSIPASAGEPAVEDAVEHLVRVYPASAGEPRSGRRRHRPATVYPRECGGTWQGAALTTEPQGLSPRVRGNLGLGFGDGNGNGSIPASAGEPQPPPKGRTP